jgi:Flp pilus assembly secretin CpaC
MIVLILSFLISNSYTFDSLNSVNVLHTGDSLRIEATDIKRITVTNKRVIRVLKDGEALLINGKARGTASLHIWRKDKKDSEKYVFTVLSAQVYKKVSELKSLLKNVHGIKISGAGENVYITGSVDKKEDLSLINKITASNKGVMNYVGLSNSAEDLEKEKIRKALTELGVYDVIINRTGGVLYVEASARTKKQIENSEHYLRSTSPNGKFDIKLVPYQIDIDVKIVEISRSESRQMGLELPGEFSLTRHTVLSKIEVDSILRLSEAHGRAKLVSNPSLSANDGENARFHAGGAIPIKLASRYNASVEWKNYGVILNFTPKVINSDIVELKILSEFSSIENNANNDAEIPGFMVREVQTVVTMDSGKSVVISGLVNRSMSRSNKGLPGVSGIPILSDLFSSNDVNDQESELAIIVTASVRFRSEESFIDKKLEELLVETLGEEL